MAKSTKKLLSLILAMIMTLSLIPAVSAAETDGTEPEITETVPAATEPAATEPAAPLYTTNAGGWVEIANAQPDSKHSKHNSSANNLLILT